ncbi:MAG: bifunctional 4-hydroxy-2-oxoglutarate aldolase/2-dehydro-3-deoxy-phosphogluconate aldolase, partial [Pseudomonadota bacterium]
MISMAELRSALRAASMVPVVTIERVEDAAPLAEALRRGGLTSIEVTLRTPVALQAIEEIKRATPDLLLGAGTILSEGDIDASLKAGADFLVTPGASKTLARRLLDVDAPSVPGVATASEAIARFDEGFALQKFFPASAAGGPAYLKALGGPLPHIDFMATGGINTENAKAYLALDNVAAVGGSWVGSASDLEARDWAAIEAKA